MQVYNTTDDVIEQRFCQFNYIIGPDEVKEVKDDCGDHLIRKQGMNGLVKLDYGMKEEDQFGSLKNYKIFKRIDGLKKYREWTKHCLDQESMFKREVTQKNGGEVELAITQVPHLEKRLKRIDALISEAQKSYDDYLKSKSSETKESKESIVIDQKPVKRGRPFKRDVINVNSATA